MKKEAVASAGYVFLYPLLLVRSMCRREAHSARKTKVGGSGLPSQDTITPAGRTKIKWCRGWKLEQAIKHEK